MHIRPLNYGQAPRDRYVGRTDGGSLADLGRAVFPIVTQRPDGVLVAIGTGFFIAENGIFVTAAHVIEEVLDDKGNATVPFGLIQFLPDDHFCVRPIHRVTRHLVADVAIGVATPMNHKTTGAPIPNNILALAERPPLIGSSVCTYAYPKTTVQPGKPQIVRVEPGFYDGLLTEHFPNGRDKVILPGPCFRTSIVLHGGTSGGPVVGPDGTVFAVNSTGFESDELSYVSCVSEILDLAISGIVLPGSLDPHSTSLRELIDRGFVLRR